MYLCYKCKANPVFDMHGCLEKQFLSVYTSYDMHGCLEKQFLSVYTSYDMHVIRKIIHISSFASLNGAVPYCSIDCIGEHMPKLAKSYVLHLIKEIKEEHYTVLKVQENEKIISAENNV